MYKYKGWALCSGSIIANGKKNVGSSELTSVQNLLVGIGKKVATRVTSCKGSSLAYSHFYMVMLLLHLTWLKLMGKALQ